MKEEPDYSRDLADIRSMMERSSRFDSLSGWEGIFAGMYALVGAYVALFVIGFDPDSIAYAVDSGVLMNLVWVGFAVFMLALVTAAFFSSRKSAKKGEAAWNGTTRRLVTGMAIPLASGGVLIGILIHNGLIGLVAPLMLVFYGLALYNASRYTISEVGILAMVQIALGLLGAAWVEHGMLMWALGFGVAHILFGISMQLRYGK